MDKEKIGIYGGSFSPIHEGHVRAAVAFLDSMKLDKLLVIPTGNPPHKVIDSATAEERFEMARLAFCDTEAYKSGRLEISDYEMTREGKSYTVYTLEHFASDSRELYMLVGTDMFLSLHKWFRCEDIFALASIVLVRRENDADKTVQIEEKKKLYRTDFNARIFEINEPPTVISSTEIRTILKDGDGVAEYIPPAVEDYISKRNLYKDKNK